MHEESSSRRKADENVQEGAVPAYLLDREDTTRAKVCLFFLFKLRYL
jgi:ribosome biogenesis protein NSA2